MGGIRNVMKQLHYNLLANKCIFPISFPDINVLLIACIKARITQGLVPNLFPFHTLTKRLHMQAVRQRRFWFPDNIMFHKHLLGLLLQEKQV